MGKILEEKRMCKGSLSFEIIQGGGPSVFQAGSTARAAFRLCPVNW